ncbi:MAG: glycosyltransferase family 4 protein [Acidobacteria bacterium]|nr:glycosyltransferase family 4 protein [Acidobacteriota bacterium]
MSGTERPLRIALVAPVAQRIPPERSGSIESVTALLAAGLVARGHDVTLYAAGSSNTPAALHATFPRGYHEDDALWPWELCELFNIAAAVEPAKSGDRFDLIHAQAEYAPIALAFTRLAPIPIIQTVHHWPTDPEVALWSRYPEAPFIAVSQAQARRLRGLNVAGVIHHAVDVDALPFRATPDDYVLFLGRFTEGKGVLDAIAIARQAGQRLILAAAENDYYRDQVAPHVDGEHVLYRGEVDRAGAAALLGGARALLYPVTSDEPFGLVVAEAMACGTPVAALHRGAVPELIDSGVTGIIARTPAQLADALPAILAFDRGRVRERAIERFHPDRMVDRYLGHYTRLAFDGVRQ